MWTNHREPPSPGRAQKNAAQEALLECCRRIVFQESAQPGQAMVIKMLINRTQQEGLRDK